MTQTVSRATRVLEYPLQRFLICLHSPQRADNAAAASCLALQWTWLGSAPPSDRPPEPAPTGEARLQPATMSARLPHERGCTCGDKKWSHQERLSDAHSRWFLRNFTSCKSKPKQAQFNSSFRIQITFESQTSADSREPSALISACSSPSFDFISTRCY